MVGLTARNQTGIIAVLSAIALSTITLLAVGQEARRNSSRPTNEVFRDDFETLETGWVAEGGDVTRRVRAQDRTTDGSHSGQRCERIAVTTGNGTHLYYSFPIGRALVADDLKISIWVKADRPGVQLLARAVFPRERDPDTLQLLGTLIPGTTYDQAGEWQRLELPRPDLATERQARLLRASLNRNVDTREAYVDRVFLNVYAGPGDITVFTDDMEVSPVLSDNIRTASAILGQPGEQAGPEIEVSQDRLLVANRPRLMRAVRAPGVSPATLKEFGFNVTAVEWPLDLEGIEQAVTAGLWLMPQLPLNFVSDSSPQNQLSQLLGELPFRESVLCWDVGTNLGAEESKVVTAMVRDLRARSPRRPIAADVSGSFHKYSRELEMVATHRWPIGTAMGMREYRDWLTYRRRLARPGTYFYTWIQASDDPREAGHVPNEMGPEPDQIRLLTYSALASGCRGLAFWADRSLGQPGAGRERLLQLGLLNLELQLLEPYFASAGSSSTESVETTPNVVKRGPGAAIHDERASFGKKRGGAGGFAPLPKQQALNLTDREDVQATLLRNDNGLVVIPIWYGKGAQFVAGQLAANDLSMVIPGIPEAAQAWQVTPVEIRPVKRERVAGGTRLTLQEFDLTAIVLLSSDVTSLDQLRRELIKTRPLAALWAAELATTKLEKAKHVNAQLASLGHPQPDSFSLIQTAEERLISGRTALQHGDFAASYNEAQRALRAVRVLERAHWDDAVTRCAHLKDSPKLCVPQASPFATTFASLPEHWRFMRTVETSQFGPNLIAGGEFESAETLSEDGWTQILDTNHELELNATLSAQDPHRGERSLHLQVKPRDDQTLPAALDPMLAALVSRPIPVKQGDLLRIRFWLRVPAPIQGSIEGATVFDSIGGTRLAIWQSEPLEWKQYTLYRRVTHLDQFTLSIGLTGIGDVYLDDLVIQRAVPGAPITQQSKATPARR